ncbi:MAG: restriction endonuclease subunit S, partial [Crocinitomicaceae bacterium]|nr:restriction endonuclease subunit S [Crocinitomicaceae bacterium]
MPIQTIYKRWFVEFEFPDKDDKFYQNNGGHMIESEFGEIPKGWRYGNLNDLALIEDGDRGSNYPSQE